MRYACLYLALLATDQVKAVRELTQQVRLVDETTVRKLTGHFVIIIIFSNSLRPYAIKIIGIIFVAERLERWDCTPEVSGLSPTLTASWIYFGSPEFTVCILNHVGHIENDLFTRKCVTPTKSIFFNFLTFWLFFAATGSPAIHLPPLHLHFARLQIRSSFSSFLFFPPDKSETQISILARLVISCRQTKTRIITNHNRPDKATNQSYWS